MVRTCNKCGETKDVIDMVKSSRYKFGVRPLCLKCHNRLDRQIKGKEIIDYIPKPELRKERDSLKEALMILIKNGYARNEEEARKYIDI